MKKTPKRCCDCINLGEDVDVEFREVTLFCKITKDCLGIGNCRNKRPKTCPYNGGSDENN